jgi:citrate lyase synthetase
MASNIQLFLQLVIQQPKHVREDILTILQNKEITIDEKVEIISSLVRQEVDVVAT